MKEITLKAYAKVNLALKVRGRERGYHLLDMLNVSVNIFDTVTVRKRTDGKVTAGSDIYIKGNNALRVAEYIIKKYNLGGVDIYIEKGIPIGGGLGGSSADSAAVIYALGRLYDIKFAEDFIEFGSDIPFQLIGGVKIVGGRGEHIEAADECFEALSKYKFLIVKPDGNTDAGEIFRQYDNAGKGCLKGKFPSTEGWTAEPDGVVQCKLKSDKNNQTNFSSESLKEAIFTADREGICRNAQNSLYEAVCAIMPEVGEIREYLAGKAEFAVMSGSGSSIVAAFLDGNALMESAVFFKEKEYYTVITEPVPYGVTENIFSAGS